MKTSSKIFLAFSFLLVAPLAQTANKMACTGTPHTLHVLSTNQTATCVLSRLYEGDKFCLVDTNGNDITDSNLTINPGQDMKFGMIFIQGADFNMEYAVTCVKKDGGYAQSPKVIFTVGADNPATPNITIVNLYGAKGSWTATDVGENYNLTF